MSPTADLSVERVRHGQGHRRGAGGVRLSNSNSASAHPAGVVKSLVPRHGTSPIGVRVPLVGSIQNASATLPSQSPAILILTVVLLAR